MSQEIEPFKYTERGICARFRKATANWVNQAKFATLIRFSSIVGKCTE